LPVLSHVCPGWFPEDEKSTESSNQVHDSGGGIFAILLYGMALVFGFTGTTQIGEIAAVCQRGLPVR